MRTSVLSSLLLLGVLVGPAHADRKNPASSVPTVATLGPTNHADALTTGDRALTGPAGSRTAGRATYLTASEIAAQVAPYSPEIERCYLERAGEVKRTGRLDLTVMIARDGVVTSVRAAAPGLPANAARRIEACVRNVVEPVRFPARRADTTAIVPYEFQKTHAPGAGPLISCWNPHGC
ncbi:MAG TPA: hypothetical protein VFT22_28375 [Kofleriaceae bacterium]|nr:hypothetical protein [Kofleriaceae bacterium]